MGQLHCGSAQYLATQLSQNNGMAAQRAAIEQFTTDFVNGACDKRSAVVEIPVVFHVVYRTGAENISDARLMAQLDVLNQDYSRTNADASNTPSAFSGLGADTEIQFCLATRAPNCGNTTGITRTLTSTVSFIDDDKVKSTSTGGIDPWPTDEYLNIWVCNLGNNLLGYAQFPGGNAATDGVVCLYSSVGGPASPGTLTPYHLGRSGSHEVGHWLNLNHIWGDDGSACTGSDNVADTPNQAGSNFGCPSFPNVSCSNGPDGDMFMNYMDYTDDACMNIFTYGQSDRMHACLESFRASLFNSLGCSPGQTAVDLYMRDSPGDVGDEPNTITGSNIWSSNDIWVRNSQDGITTHQNPIYGQTNYVYVRILNKGCTSSTGTEELNLYWTKASTVGPWPSAWNGTVNFSCGTNPIRGDQINSSPISIPVIGPSGSTIIAIPWSPPNPALYACTLPAGAGAWEEFHFCLAARIVTSSTPPYGMTFPEVSSIGTNTRKNNNIAWKNLQIDPPTIATLVASNEQVPTEFNLIYAVPEREINNPITEAGDITIELGQELFNRWRAGGEQGEGFVVDRTRDYTIQITSPRAVIGNILLNPTDNFVPIFRIEFDEPRNGTKCIFMYEVMLENLRERMIVGGVSYEIHKPICTPVTAGGDVYSTPGQEVMLGESTRMDGEFEWTNMNTGVVLGTTETIEVAPMVTTTYRFKSHLESGCIGEDEMTVFVGGAFQKNGVLPNKPLELEAMPNPFGSMTTLRFTIPETCDAKLEVIDGLGRVVESLYSGPAEGGKEYKTEFKAGSLENGIYFARLTACGYTSQFTKLVLLK